jgi:hypothetical protein
MLEMLEDGIRGYSNPLMWYCQRWLDNVW